MRSFAAQTSSRSTSGSMFPSTMPSQGDLRVGVVPLDQLHFDRGAGRYDDRPVRHRVRADRRHDQHVEIQLDDWPAARQGIRRRAGRRRDDDAVAGMVVHESAVTRVSKSSMRPVADFGRTMSFRPSDSTTVPSPRGRHAREERALLGGELAFEGGVDVRQHVLRHDVGEEAEAATG